MCEGSLRGNTESTVTVEAVAAEGSSPEPGSDSFPNRLDPFDDEGLHQVGFGAAFDACRVRYLAELRRRGHSRSNRHKTGVILADLGAFLQMEADPRPRALSDLTAEHVAAFRDREITRPKKTTGTGSLSVSSMCGLVAILRGFFNYLASQGIVLLDPARDLACPRRRETLPRAIPSARQVKRLLTTPSEDSPLGLRDRAVLELLYSTGLRNAEVCALLVGNVDLESRLLHVRNGKGGKDRVTPIGTMAVQAIERYFETAWPLLRHKRGYGLLMPIPPGGKAPESSDSLFLTRRGTSLKAQDLRALVRLYRGQASLKTPVTPHALRHACATHLLRGGANVRHIQLLLGHASLKSTEIYTRVEPKDLKRMLDRCHPRSVRTPAQA